MITIHWKTGVVQPQLWGNHVILFNGGDFIEELTKLWTWSFFLLFICLSYIESSSLFLAQIPKLCFQLGLVNQSKINASNFHTLLRYLVNGQREIERENWRHIRANELVALEAFRPSGGDGVSGCPVSVIGLRLGGNLTYERRGNGLSHRERWRPFFLNDYARQIERLTSDPGDHASVIHRRADIFQHALLAPEWQQIMPVLGGRSPQCSTGVLAERSYHYRRDFPISH